MRDQSVVRYGGDWATPYKAAQGGQRSAVIPVDRSAFDEGQFASDGGFARLNKQFEGRLEQLLGELADDIWQRPDVA